MTTTAVGRIHVLLRLAILAVSALIMIWLLWRFPIETGIATVAILGLLVLITPLAASGDSDGGSDVGTREDGLHTH
jgi:hypothetical protein